MTDEKQQDHVIMLSNVRLAFPELFEASAVKEGDKPAFSGAFLLAPGHPDIERVKQAVAAVAQAKWPQEVNTILPMLVAGDKICLRNGDLKAQYDGFPGNMYVSARGYKRPLLLGPDKAPLVESDGLLYSGCYVNAQVAIWAQQNNYGKRINAQLRGVQFLRHGDAFGGGAVAQPDEFGVVENDADGAPPAPGAAEDYSSLLG